MNVLIITYTDDNYCIENVTEAIEKKGGKVYRFNTDKYPTEYMMTASYSNGFMPNLRLIGPDFDIDLQKEVDAIWYRRIRIGQELPQELDIALKVASIREAKHTLYGMKDSLGKFTLDPFTKMRYTENKQLQLQLAREVGLDIPDTIFTNNKDEVKAFYDRLKKPLITKMQHSFAVEKNGKEHVVFTNELQKEDIDEIDGLDLCPMTFQEKIEKKLELRVTIVGNKVFTAAIDSQKYKNAKVDWRREGEKSISDWVAYKLPTSIESKMLDMMDILGLNYGAGDIIITEDDRYVFLEINPAGEFFWIDKLLNGEISDAIADILVGNVARRRNDILLPFEENLV